MRLMLAAAVVGFVLLGGLKGAAIATMFVFAIYLLASALRD
jgi:hypothetical protein